MFLLCCHCRPAYNRTVLLAPHLVPQGGHAYPSLSTCPT